MPIRLWINGCLSALFSASQMKWQRSLSSVHLPMAIYLARFICYVFQSILLPDVDWNSGIDAAKVFAQPLR